MENGISFSMAMKIMIYMIIFSTFLLAGGYGVYHISPAASVSGGGGSLNYLVSSGLLLLLLNGGLASILKLQVKNTDALQAQSRVSRHQMEELRREKEALRREIDLVRQERSEMRDLVTLEFEETVGGLLRRLQNGVNRIHNASLKSRMLVNEIVKASLDISEASRHSGKNAGSISLAAKTIQQANRQMIAQVTDARQAVKESTREFMEASAHLNHLREHAPAMKHALRDIQTLRDEIQSMAQLLAGNNPRAADLDPEKTLKSFREWLSSANRTTRQTIQTLEDFIGNVDDMVYCFSQVCVAVKHVDATSDQMVSAIRAKSSSNSRTSQVIDIKSQTLTQTSDRIAKVARKNGETTRLIGELFDISSSLKAGFDELEKQTQNFIGSVRR